MNRENSVIVSINLPFDISEGQTFRDHVSWGWFSFSQDSEGISHGYVLTYFLLFVVTVLINNGNNILVWK